MLDSRFVCKERVMLSAGRVMLSMHGERWVSAGTLPDAVGYAFCFDPNTDRRNDFAVFSRWTESRWQKVEGGVCYQGRLQVLWLEVDRAILSFKISIKVRGCCCCLDKLLLYEPIIFHSVMLPDLCVYRWSATTTHRQQPACFCRSPSVVNSDQSD